jgi:hypothetical protein
MLGLFAESLIDLHGWVEFLQNITIYKFLRFFGQDIFVLFRTNVVVVLMNQLRFVKPGVVLVDSYKISSVRRF